MHNSVSAPRLTPTMNQAANHDIGLELDEPIKKNHSKDKAMNIVEGEPNSQPINTQHMVLERGEDSLSDLSAPPSFLVPAYVNQAHTVYTGNKGVEQEREPNIGDITKGLTSNEDLIMGKEGALVWKKHFAPTMDSTNVI